MALTRSAVAGAVALLWCLAATPAHAVLFEFFEGNGCTQARVRVHDTTDMRSPRVLMPLRYGGNDEIRSVRLSSNWRHQSTRRTVQVDLYDAPKEDRRDDWVRIVVDDATRIPAEGLCIGTLERNFDQGGVHLERHPRNGIDGKVSYIQFVCNAACRDRPTPAP